MSLDPNGLLRVPRERQLGQQRDGTEGFWSITVYNAKDKDGQITIHFGGDPYAANYLRIMPGWNYTARLYTVPGPQFWTEAGPSLRRVRQTEHRLSDCGSHDAVPSGWPA
jgi:hypothetical protein